MMLIALTILFPLVHSVRQSDRCHAVGFKAVHTSSLPGPILEQLEKKEGIIWDDRNSFAVYYRGFPDSQRPKVQFVAACVVGLKSHPFRHCVNATAIGETLSGHTISVDDFQNFYKECNNKVLPDFDTLEIEREDDFDKGLNEDDLELEELEEQLGGEDDE